MPSDWERVVADPALLAAVRARYRGAGDALDRLWWLEHPGTTAPSGAQDPGAQLEADRDALYRPGAGATAAARFERAAASAAEDRDAVLRALREADAEHPSTAPAPSPSASAPRGRIRRRTVAGAVVAALLVGAAGGVVAERSVRASSSPAALAVFDRAQRDDDRPPSGASLPAGVLPASLRLLGASTSTGTAVYAARSGSGAVCVVAVVLADESVASCASEAAFAVSGLSLTFRAAADPVDDSGVSTPREISPSWSPEGRLTF